MASRRRFLAWLGGVVGVAVLPGAWGVGEGPPVAVVEGSVGLMGMVDGSSFASVRNVDGPRWRSTAFGEALAEQLNAVQLRMNREYQYLFSGPHQLDLFGGIYGRQG